jgi:hypothetical protein
MRLSRWTAVSWTFWVALASFLIDVRLGQTTESPEIHIHSLDPSVDIRSLEGPGVRLHPAPQASPRRQAGRKKSELPARSERDALLARAGLTEAMKDWDELSRDQLFLRAQALELQRFKSLYPDLPATSLESLSKALRGTR